MNDDKPSPNRVPWLVRILVVLLIGVFITRVVLCAWDKSAANDEPKHLISGLAYLQTGICCLGGNNTALTGWSALPEYLLGPAKEDFGEPAIHWRYFRARLTNLPWILLLGLGIFFWSKELFGPWAGLLSLWVFAWSPNMVAHAALVSPDFQVTALMFCALYALRSFVTRPFTVARLWWATLLFALAQIAKYTALVIVPLYGLAPLFLSATLRERTRRVAASIAVVTMGFGVIGFLYEGPALLTEPKISREGFLDLVQDMLRLPLPVDALIEGYESGRLPTGYVKGFVDARHSLDIGYGTYLNGQVSPARWLYYPETFLIKTPLATLLLGCVALAGIIGALRRRWLDAVLLLLPPTILVAAAMSSSLQLGLRHLLPAYPFLFVLIGAAAKAFGARFWRRIVLMLILGGGVHAGVACHPHYLAYFNQLVGGPERGHLYLIGENLDWGQDLRRLAQYQEENEIETLWFRYFGSVNPIHYGVEAKPLPLDTPVTGWIVVSRTRYMAEAEELNVGVAWPMELRGFSWLDPFTPKAILGHSLLIYHLTPEDLARVSLVEGQKTR